MYAKFQVMEHWHHRLDERKRKGYMTEHKKINNTVTASMLLNRRKAEIERLADPGSRKPTSSSQWKPFGQLNCATKDIVKNGAPTEHAVRPVPDHRLQPSFWSGEHGAC